MGMLCAVSFNRYGRLYYFDPGEFRPGVGDRVLVATDDGPEVAECVWAPQWVDDAGDPPRLVGLAGPDDLRRDELQRNLMLRHRLMQTTRRFLSDNGFFEIETPADRDVPVVSFGSGSDGSTPPAAAPSSPPPAPASPPPAPDQPA